MPAIFKKIALFALFFISFSLAGQAQQVPVIKFAELQKIRNNPADTLYVVNYWATWCKPCINELPYFEAANQQYQGQPVKVVLVSLDSKIDLKTKVLPFVRKRNLKAQVLLLDEPDANSWIDKIEPQWSGAIPATMFFNNARKTYFFVEKELSETELNNLIEQYKPQK